MRPNGELVLDIGDSRFAGVHVDVPELLTLIAEDVGWELEDVETIRNRVAKDGNPLCQKLLRLCYPVAPADDALAPAPDPASDDYVISQAERVSSGAAVHARALLEAKGAADCTRWLSVSGEAGGPRSRTSSSSGSQVPKRWSSTRSAAWARSPLRLDSKGGQPSRAISAILAVAMSARAKVESCRSGSGDAERAGPGRLYLTARRDRAGWSTCRERARPRSFENSTARSRTSSIRAHFARSSLARQFSRGGPRRAGTARKRAHGCPAFAPGNRPYALSRRSHPVTPLKPTGESYYRPLIAHVERRLALSAARTQ